MLDLNWAGARAPAAHLIWQAATGACSHLRPHKPRPLAGGFHSFLVALSGPVLSQFYGQSGITPQDAYEPELGRIIPYMVCIAFIGIFVVLVLRKAMIIDFRLPWPSSTAGASLLAWLAEPLTRAPGSRSPMLR